MNISRKWLNDYVNITATDHEFDAAMTMSGTKVETTEVLSAEIKNAVIGKVLEITRLTHSVHIWICSWLRAAKSPFRSSPAHRM